MKQVKTRKNFTLVELLVSLGVFSILLIVFMQFFSGMRLVWTNAEKNSTAHTDVRVAMDYLSVLLGSLYYSTANTPNAEKGYKTGKTIPKCDILSHKRCVKVAFRAGVSTFCPYAALFGERRI